MEVNCETLEDLWDAHVLSAGQEWLRLILAMLAVRSVPYLFKCDSGIVVCNSNIYSCNSYICSKMYTDHSNFHNYNQHGNWETY